MAQPQESGQARIPKKCIQSAVDQSKARHDHLRPKRQNGRSHNHKSRARPDRKVLTAVWGFTLTFNSAQPSYSKYGAGTITFPWNSRLIPGYSLKTRRSPRPMEETVFQPVTV